MGFFSDLKHDLSQAVNELMPEEDLKAIPPSPKDVIQKEMIQEDRTKVNLASESRSLEEMLENIDSIQLPEELTRELSEETEKIVDGAVDVNKSIDTKPSFSEMDEVDLESMLENVIATKVSDEVSIIAAGMTVAGDIASDGSLDIMGSVNGNVAIWGRLNITGKLTGDSKAAGVYAKGAKINGLVISDGAFEIDAASVVIGDISATSAVIAGAVKGDIDVRGPVILESSAIVMGNIKSKSVQINNGAVIEGMCSQCYADVVPTAFFDDFKPDINKLRT